jgi:hypothetical protein
MKYKELLNISILEHKFQKTVDIPVNIQLEQQPKNDINTKTEKLKFLPLEKISPLYSIFRSDIGKSVFFHFCMIACFFITDFIFLNLPPQPTVMEVTFGLTSEMGKVTQDVQKTPLEGQRDATKTKEDLAQLPKHVVPDTGQKQAILNQEKIIKTEKKPDSLEFKEKKVVKPLPPKKIVAENKKVEGPKQEKKQKINEKEFLKRKEEDLRQIAEKKEQGIHNRDKKKPLGVKHILNDLPKSPFQTSDSLPNAPAVLTPTGAENGVDVSIYNSYRLYLQNQLKINWNTTEGSAYPKELNTSISFTINQFGYLIGEPKLIKKSGNSDFDSLVITSLTSTFPVSNPPPKNINPPQTFKATYSAKDIK